MSQDIFAKVILRLTNTYGAPNVPDPEALSAEFCKALKGYNPSYLEAALDKIIRSRTFPGWPTVGEVVAEVAAVAASRTKAPEHVKFNLEPPAEKKYVDPSRVKDLMAGFQKALTGNNSFEAIIERTPIGGTADVDAPWGMEVTDKDGRIVPIRQKKGNAA